MPSDDIASSAASPTIQVLGGGRISCLYIIESKCIHKILCFVIVVFAQVRFVLIMILYAAMFSFIFSYMFTSCLEKQGTFAKCIKFIPESENFSNYVNKYIFSTSS